MNETDFQQIEANLREALEYERTLNKRLCERLDTYQDILKMLLKLLITEVKEGR